MEDTLRFAVLPHAMDVRIYGPLLVLLALSTLSRAPTACAIVLARLNDIFSWLLNVVLHRFYPIKTANSRVDMPTCPYRWPNGQGDIGKFLQGMENSEIWKHKYGDVYRIWSGTSSEVVLTRPEDIRSVFKDSDSHRKAADNNAGWLMGEILGKCLGLISGPDWRTLHAVMKTPFLRKNSVEYIPRIERQTERYFNDLCLHGRLGQGLLNPIDDLKLLPFWITAEIIYGELPPEAEQKLQNLIPIRESLFRHMISGKLTRFKLYKYLPTTANRELSKFKKGWSDFNSKAYQHSVMNNRGVPLLHMYESATRREITFEQLLQTLDEILFANLDVTMGALSWNLLFLGAHHDFQASLRAEILTKRKESHGNGGLWEKYLLSSTTLLAVAVLESARLKPLAAFSVPQAAPTERNVGGFIVPAGTNFIIDSLALNVRNPFWGQDTLDYRPTRFLAIQNSDIRYQYWRFGFGSRTCMGRHVADLILRIVLVQLVEGYRLSLMGDKSDWQRNDKTWIIHPDTDIRCEKL